MNQLILPPTYVDSRPCLQLGDRVYRRFDHGDVTVFISWHGPNLEPCLVLAPTHELGREEAFVPCIFPLSLIGRYVPDAEPEERLEANRFLMQCAHALCLDQSARTLHRLKGLVIDHLGDLLECPPRPRQNERVTADAILTDPRTGKQTHTEIKDDV